MPSENTVSRRERQVMDVLFQAGEASVAEVRRGMPNPPSYSAVRTMLRILEEKGLVEHRAEGRRYVYCPKRSTRLEGRSALGRVLRVFFGGSLEQALAAHFSSPSTRVDDAELQRLRSLIDEIGQQESTGWKGGARETRKGKKP